MNAASLTTAMVNVKTAQTAAQVQMAVAAKMLDTANQQGQAVTQLIEAAAENMSQTVADAAGQLGAGLDTVA